MFLFSLFFPPNVLTVFWIAVQYTQYPRQVQVVGLPARLSGLSASCPTSSVGFLIPWDPPSQASSVEELASRGTLAPGPLPHLYTPHTWLPVPCIGIMPSSWPEPQPLHPHPCPDQRPPTSVQGAGSIQLLFWQDIPVRPAHHTLTSDIWALS